MRLITSEESPFLSIGSKRIQHITRFKIYNIGIYLWVD